MVLLSRRFNEHSLTDEIVGEVMNNDTDSAEYVQALAVFRDPSGAIIYTAWGYADPDLVIANDSASFKILLTSDIIKDEAVTYDLTLKWRDPDFEEFIKDAIRGQPLRGGDNDDDDASSGNNVDGCKSNLECQLEENREWAKDHIGNFVHLK